MKPYPKYKPSDIQWLGNIPEHWEVKKLKYIVNSKLEYGANESAELEDRSLPRYIRITDFSNDGKLKEDTFKSLSEEAALGYLLQEGDILFARSGATVGKTFQFKNYQGLACYAGYLIKASPNSNLALSDFVYYFTKSDIYENWKNSIFVQATIQNIGADKYNQLELPIPPLPEQTTIAQFLDQKTAQIDTLIAQKQRLISLLKEERMAFINEILSDESFPLKKLKYVVEVISKGTTPSTEGKTISKEGEIRYLKAENIVKNQVSPSPEFFIDVETNEILKRSKLEENDILIVIAGATIGKVAILSKDLIPANTNQAVCFIRLNKGENYKYFWHYLQSQMVIDIIALDSVQSAQPNLSMEKIANFEIPYPDKETQQKIVESIETTTGKIDATLAKIIQEIELLKEYRVALISEVVTGKVSVFSYQ